MKTSFCLFIITALCVFVQNGNAQPPAYNPDQLLSVAELRADFTLLRNSYQQKHPNLYLYTPKQRLDAIFDSLYQHINKPATAAWFYQNISFLVSQIKDGHGYMLPSQKSRDYFNSHEKFLPLDVAWLDGKMYLQKNCSADTGITAGAEILSINGASATEIFYRLMQRQVRDGNNQTYPVWIINNYFREYYSYAFGYPAIYNITCKTGGIIKKLTIAALPKDSIRFYRLSGKPKIEKEKQGITLKLDDVSTAATLTIKTFDSDDLKDEYSQNFTTTIQDYFTQIKEHNVQHLVLDLRDNQGGDPENGITLLSHLLSQPFTMIYEGPVSVGLYKPAQDVYTGKLYILINGGSFSCTGMVSSCLQQNNCGTFIGQETGGNKYILSGDADEIILPNTKIECQISTVPYILRAQYNNDGHGVMPDYTVAYSIEDIIMGKDKEAEKAKELIRKDNKY